MYVPHTGSCVCHLQCNANINLGHTKTRLYAPIAIQYDQTHQDIKELFQPKWSRYWLQNQTLLGNQYLIYFSRVSVRQGGADIQLTQRNLQPLKCEMLSIISRPVHHLINAINVPPRLYSRLCEWRPSCHLLSGAFGELGHERDGIKTKYDLRCMYTEVADDQTPNPFSSGCNRNPGINVNGPFLHTKAAIITAPPQGCAWCRFIQAMM